jgi:hypothetical protein
MIDNSQSEFDDTMLVDAKVTLFMAALQGEGFSNETLARGTLQAVQNWLYALSNDAYNSVIDDFEEQAPNRVSAQPEELDLEMIVLQASHDVKSLSGPDKQP